MRGRKKLVRERLADLLTPVVHQDLDVGRDDRLVAGDERVGVDADEAALVEWGQRIGRNANAPLVLALRGELGAGKTTLARAIARGMGIAGPIPSPTFNLMFRYEAPSGVHVVHIDLFRLEHPEDVWALGWADLPESNELVMIEWPDKAEELLPTPRWDMTLREHDDPDLRVILL